jgi:hypothetical protein
VKPADIFRPREINMRDAHNKAAEQHESAAKSHRAAAEAHGRNDHVKGKEHSNQAQQHTQSASEQSKAAQSKSAQHAERIHWGAGNRVVFPVACRARSGFSPAKRIYLAHIASEIGCRSACIRSMCFA